MISEIIQNIRQQKRISIARAITLVENEIEGDSDLLSGLFPYTGNAYRIGITGPPGAGKSSLTDKLIKIYREQDKTVAVIGVDPTSPFTGGALLGDRIRMVNHSGDEGVFIRSMASRGGHGGLAQKTQEVGDIFDAASFDIILFETVGVGQVELDVVQATDTVLVVLVPESGDEIQMMKAGLMEIGDIFVINKSDRDGSNKLNITLNNLLSAVGDRIDQWRAKVANTVATRDVGIPALAEIIETHRAHILNTGLWRQKLKTRYTNQVKELILGRFEHDFWREMKVHKLENEIQKPRLKRMSPYVLAQQLYKNS